MNKVNELFCEYTNGSSFPDLTDALINQPCKFRFDGKCTKNRKSDPGVMIGTCSLCFNSVDQALLICPDRLTENNLIFRDCLRYIDYDKCELFLIPEVTIPVGHVDYVLAAFKGDVLHDFVGIELQTMDTTGSIWPERQQMLIDNGYKAEPASPKNVGVNWKMTAKTILAQIVQKTQIFETIGYKLVLICQTPLYNYMERDFNFSEVILASENEQSTPTYFHSYDYLPAPDNCNMTLSLNKRTTASLEAIEKIMLAEIDKEQALKTVSASIISKTNVDYHIIEFN